VHLFTQPHGADEERDKSNGTLASSLAIISGAMIVLLGLIGLVVRRNWASASERIPETTPRSNSSAGHDSNANVFTNNPAAGGSVFDISTTLSIRLPQCPEASFSATQHNGVV
jgi:hypothetical protein